MARGRARQLVAVLAPVGIIIALLRLRVRTNARGPDAQPAQRALAAASPLQPDPTAPGPGWSPWQSAVPPAATMPRRWPRAARINALGALLMLGIAGTLVPVAWVLLPDTSGPPPGRPTIAGFVFSVDTPGTDAAVRILINPDARAYTAGAPGLMQVAVDLDIPAGRSVRWILDLQAVSTKIKLEDAPASSTQPRQQAARLIAAPETYEMPLPIGQVRDYVLVGEIDGPSSAYTQLAASNFLPAGNSDTSFTRLAWSGPLPAVFKGAYVTATVPSLTAVSNTATSSSGFDFGWTPVSPQRFHAVEQLALPADYQISSGNRELRRTPWLAVVCGRRFGGIRRDRRRFEPYGAGGHSTAALRGRTPHRHRRVGAHRVRAVRARRNHRSQRSQIRSLNPALKG